MIKKRAKIGVIILAMIIIVTTSWYLHPSFVWTTSQSHNFSRFQLFTLEYKLRAENFISLANTKTIYAKYDEYSTQFYIDTAILVSRCDGEGSYCVQGDKLYAAYKKYGRKNIAMVDMRLVSPDGEIHYQTLYYAWRWGVWILFDSGF